MNASLQTWVSFAIVLGAAGYLLLRWRAKRAKPGCGGDCGCDSSQLRSRVRENR